MDKNKLYRYFEGTASDEEMQEIRTWSEQNEDNEALLRRERKLFDAIILSGHSEELAAKSREPKALPHLWRAAAVLVFVVGLAMLIKYMGWGTEQPLALQKVVVPKGQRVNLILPDSSVVWLNSGSTLEYAVDFGADSREVTLDGEGYFDIRHHEDKPFIVHTSKADVTDLGTKFNVESYKQTDDFSISLMKGCVSVNLATSSGNNKPRPVILRPDEMVHLEGGKLVKTRIEDHDAYRWRDGLYCFRDKSLKEILKDFEKYYDVKFIVGSGVAASHRLTGKFRIADGLDYALRVLQEEEPFTYTRSEDGNRITIRTK